MVNQTTFTMKKLNVSFLFVVFFLIVSCNSGKQTDENVVDESLEDVSEDLENESEELTDGLSQNYEEFKKDLDAASKRDVKTPDNSYKDEKGRTVYSFVSEMPTFQGGEEEMFKYLRKNLKYPRQARNNAAQGSAFVSFVVNEKGAVEDVKIARSSGNDLLDEEAIRAVSTMPNWNPGKQNGKTVPVVNTLPIKFELRN